MIKTSLEHVNYTVANIEKTAQMLVDIFDWKIRWRGEVMNGRYSIHVGTQSDYVALNTTSDRPGKGPDSYQTLGALNHIGIVVDDLEQVRKRVVDAGFEPYSFADYEPGKRFYFRDADSTEYEVVCYD